MIRLESKLCPVCKSPIRVLRREDGSAARYLPILDEYERQFVPNPISPVLKDYLKAKRLGKKTVAIVGSARSSGPWAPFGEEEIEVWCANELHGYPWVDVEGATRWFQLHPKKSFTQKHDFDHWEWLQEKHDFPIYMQQVFDDVPSSIKYPLREIQNELIGEIYRGEEKIEKLFSSTMCYQIALALWEGFSRIELFGIELIMDGEYAFQREAMAFWIGKIDGMCVEMWMPENCALLVQPLYAYEQIRKESGAITWSSEGIADADNEPV
jgi:hypothetical protein